MPTRFVAMVSWRRFAAIVTACGLLTVFPVAGAGSASTQANGNWPAFLYNAGHSSYNAAATTITPGSISSLHMVWRWATPPSTNSGPNELFAAPTVLNGVIYIGANDGYFYAINETTHAVVWSRFLALDTAKGNDACGKYGSGIISTATVASVSGKPTVFVNSPDGYLYALNATNGTVVWKGLVDTPSATVNDYYAWSSPLVANGKVYIGISSMCDSPLVPGGLLSFNENTGVQVAKWLDTPTGRYQPGGSVWSSPVLLPNGQIVVTTGNGYSQQPLYDESIVRLDPNTLKVLDYWQVPPSQQVHDADFGASPSVWTATINGVATAMVGACNKNGIYYAFAQNDLKAGPIWQTRITVPYPDPGGSAECDSAVVWDGTRLIIGGGAATTINGVTYPGSVQALDPATGVPLWQTGVTGTIVGTPSEDGGGVVAAQTYQSTSQLGVFLLNASTGAQVGFIATKTNLFGQAVFVGGDLLVGAGHSFGLQAFTVG